MAFNRTWHVHLLHKLKLKGISSQIFGLNSSVKFCKLIISYVNFLSKGQLRVVLNGKPSKEYPVNAGIPQGSILGPTLFPLCINNLSDDVICNIAIHANDTTLYFYV